MGERGGSVAPPPKLKLGSPQNYFPGAGAVFFAFCNLINVIHVYINHFSGRRILENEEIWAL